MNFSQIYHNHTIFEKSLLRNSDRKSMYIAYSDKNLDLKGQNLSMDISNISWTTENMLGSTPKAPPTFNETFLVKVMILSAICVISFVGNSATLIQMYRMRRRKSTINTLIVNLAIADLFVSVFCMAGEAIWNSTVQWLAGDAICKIFKFMQGFGPLLSTFITVVISVDRCCVILDPMSRNKAPQRVRIMIIISWFLGALFSVPQALVFVVMRGPFEEDFYQCINSFPDPWHKRLYYIFSLLVQFLLPLVIMIIAYGLIFCTISRKSKEFGDPVNTSVTNSYEHINGRGQVRNNLLRKAKRKALRMSIFIVLAFILCWFPYYVIYTGIAFGYWDKVSQQLVTGLSFVGLSTSVLNPIIYGAFQLCKVHRP
ncbi:hypothetical protein KUTeg_018525, partial [Tegillarca granosa]